MDSVEAPSETGTAPRRHLVRVTPRPWRTLRVVIIRLLEAWLARLRTSGSAPVVALLPAPTTWDPQTVQDQNDPVLAATRSPWQWLGAIVMLVLAFIAAWEAWRRLESLEQQHEEAVSMTLAAVEQKLADQRASLETMRDHVTQLAAQGTAAPSTSAEEMSRKLHALQQQVEEVELTMGAYGAILGKQQHEVAAHTEQLTTHDAALRALAATPRPVATTTATKVRTRSARASPPVTATEADRTDVPGGRPVISLPANLGAWSLGVRTAGE